MSYEIHELGFLSSHALRPVDFCEPLARRVGLFIGR